MKKYNKSEIMKTAWNTRNRQGFTRRANPDTVRALLQTLLSPSSLLTLIAICEISPNCKIHSVF